jgi:uncharacterized sporulation protein YeaH/YhbH (DUF444 family)
MAGSSGFVDPSGSGRQWYDLFSRGARDWLRHNDKVRAAVRDKLPELIAGSELLPSADRTVQVPVRFLEHARLRLREAEQSEGVGQGAGKPGDQLVQPGDGPLSKGAGGNEEGGYQFILELKIDDIVDWLWEELKLPNLKVKSGAVQYDDYTREGWSRRGVRSRLDRRRSLKEALKRRAVQSEGPPFTNDDLRYRQLAMRRRPATEAVVYFAMDVSSSMTEHDRKLAKTFFFWVVQGLRRQYTHLEAVFVAHTVEAWEFAEAEFFQVSGSGGTVASTAFRNAAVRPEPLQLVRVLRLRRRELPQRPRSGASGADGARRHRELRRLRRDGVRRAAAASVGDGAPVRAATGGDRRRGPSRAVLAGVGLGRDSRVLQPPRGGRGLA